MSKKIRPQPPAAAPAYSETLVSDGIQVFTRWSFDCTVEPTKDDLKALLRAMKGGAPLQRIENMEAALAQLPTDNPVIAMHVAEIRRIHREVLAPPIDFTKQRTERLKDADAIWLKILIIRDVMPLAAARVKSNKKQRERAKLPRKLTPEQDARAARRYAERVATGEKYGAIKELVSTYGVGESTIKKRITVWKGQ